MLTTGRIIVAAGHIQMYNPSNIYVHARQWRTPASYDNYDNQRKPAHANADNVRQKASWLKPAYDICRPVTAWTPTGVA